MTNYCYIWPKPNVCLSVQLYGAATSRTVYVADMNTPEAFHRCQWHTWTHQGMPQWVHISCTKNTPPKAVHRRCQRHTWTHHGMPQWVHVSCTVLSSGHATYTQRASFHSTITMHSRFPDSVDCGGIASIVSGKSNHLLWISFPNCPFDGISNFKTWV